MPDTSQRNFNTFCLGDNPALLAEGVLHVVATEMDVPIGTGREPESWNQLAQTLTSQNKELREVFPVRRAATLVESSAIQIGMDRSLRTPGIATPSGVDIIMLGAAAGHQDRTASLLGRRQQTLNPNRVWLPAGQRIMNSGENRSNPRVNALVVRNGEYPTEFDYANDFTVPGLQTAGYNADAIQLLRTHSTSSRDVVGEFAQRHPEVFESGRKIAAAHVANKGIQLALELRAAGREVNPVFDADPHEPQIYVVTSEMLPLASADSELRNPHYQSPYAVLCQLATTAALLAEAAQ